MLQRYLISPSSYRKIHKYCDCIIIGSGIAGLSTAMRLAKDNNIKVLTKSSLSDSTTWYAQGGIAAAIRKPDLWKTHYEDTITAGQGLCDPKDVEILVHESSCVGVLGMDINTGKVEIHPASNVIIASGGIGQIYDLTTNPSISTGDGIAMAHRAGAAIMDIEFIQFHPTVFKTRDSKLFLISEALRGEGAILRDCNGERFMVGKHPKAELAPRDIVVKEMTRIMDKCGTDYVYLDATEIPEGFLKIRFPNIISKLKENGLDLKKDLIKVSPAEHYLNGGD